MGTQNLYDLAAPTILGLSLLLNVGVTASCLLRVCVSSAFCNSDLEFCSLPIIVGHSGLTPPPLSYNVVSQYAHTMPRQTCAHPMNCTFHR